MIPCVGWAPVKSPAPFDVTASNVEAQGGYQPQQNGVRPRLCPNADTEQAARASASDGLETYSCLIFYADNEDDYGSKKYWSKGGQSGPKGGHIKCSPLTPNIAILMLPRAFFNSIIDKHQHMHFFTFKTVLV